MVDDNLELFALDHAQFGRQIDHLDALPDDELQKNWAKTLANFVDLFKAELMRNGIIDEDAVKLALKLAATLGYYFGGRVCYIPQGEQLKIAIRDNQLYLDYQKGNGDISLLAKKYNLTDSWVYSIIREQRALHIKRIQPDMFSNKSECA